MKKLLFIIAFLILNSQFSIASPVQLPATGQTISYVAGDDGALKKGEAWQSSRFADNGDQTMTDTLTNLVWTTDGNAPGPTACTPATTKTRQGALDYVACLNTNSYLGKNDWRLPNRKELMSLVNRGEANSATWLNSQGFSGVLGSYYWSSSTDAGYTDYAWYVYMGSGFVNYYYKSSSYNVWPVRGGLAMVAGVCGSNNGKVLAVAPITELCASGTATASGVWNWSCTGMYGGATASCSATYGFPISVTVTGTGNGTVSSDAVANGVPADIRCTSGTCSAGYPNNSSVTLSAVPSVTSTFGGWTGACTGTATPCTLTVNAGKATTATFTAADRARIVGGIGYSTLGAAYSVAANGAVIKTLDTTLSENLTMNRSVAITLLGGWNTTFSSRSGLPTVLNGVLTIKSGSLTVDGLVIR